MKRALPDPANVRKVLIFRPGSLGDTVVALPALRRVAATWPQAIRVILTNRPRHGRETDIAAILDGTGLAQGYMHFDAGAHRMGLLALRREIRSFAPDVLVHLGERQAPLRIFRQLAFFRLTTGAAFVGLPVGADAEHHRDPATARWESEAAYLVRRLDRLAPFSIDAPGAFDLALAPAEIATADAALAALGRQRELIAIAPGAKMDAKDWEEPRWRELLARLARQLPDAALIAIGAPAESERVQRLAAAWRGPVVDLCGRLTPRESAAALARAKLLIAHDGGPMHLAAAVGTPVVAIFSARAQPGIWFPQGSANRVLYHHVACAGCGLETCIAQAKACIASVTVDEVLAAALDLLGRPRLIGAA